VRIQLVRGREILDSRGRPTVEADVELDDGTVGRAAAPSGSSTGGTRRVSCATKIRRVTAAAACWNVTGRIGPALRGRDPADQTGVDARLLELDGTPDKHVLGANATTAVSLAVARAAAARPQFRDALELAVEVHARVGDRVVAEGHPPLVADEGG
jgi:enolase